MKIGDLVKYKVLGDKGYRYGVVIGFDEEKDPIVHQACNGTKCAMWKYKIEVLNANR